MYIIPKNDLEHSRAALDSILSSRRLIFNPYSVSDRRLWEIVWKSGWGEKYDLTEAVMLRFSRLRLVRDYREFDGIFMCVGLSNYEVFVTPSTIKGGVTAYDSNRIEHHMVGKRKLYTDDDMKWLVGKTFFVSRIIRGRDRKGNGNVAYRMYRMNGKLKRDAAIIREAICNAKLEMLQRVIDYPEGEGNLSCDKGFFDYEPRIRRAMRIIGKYHLTPVPED